MEGATTACKFCLRHVVPQLVSITDKFVSEYDVIYYNVPEHYAKTLTEPESMKHEMWASNLIYFRY